MIEGRVGVVVVTYNSDGFVESLMGSIAGADETELEVRFVDNGSQDSTEEWLSEYVVSSDIPGHIWPTAASLGENTGFTHGANVGIKYLLENHPEIEYIALVNPDVIVCDDWVTKMAHLFTMNPRCGIIGCRHVRGNEVVHGGGQVYKDPRPLYEKVRQEIMPGIFVERKEFIAYTHFRHRLGLTNLDSWNTIETVPWVSFACVMFRREMIEDIGLLDERFFNYASDSEYCYRAWENDWEVWYTAEATVYHYVGASEEMGGPELIERRIADLRLFAQEEPKSWLD